MAIPTQAALNILREILNHVATHDVNPDDPRTFLGYKQIHDSLGLPKRAITFGDSLKLQGLATLAEWTRDEGHPAITGLIVDTTMESENYLRPGKGYFELFGRQQDFPWWRSEIVRSLAYDWDRVLAPVPPKAQEVNDLPAPRAERIPTTTYRILRDTEMARRIKVLHRYECQICGYTIQLPDGSRYAESHHIQPLGNPHNGPDVAGNILCLCPNHHAELDLGVIAISLAELRHADGHPVDANFVAYHNRRIHAQRIA